MKTLLITLTILMSFTGFAQTETLVSEKNVVVPVDIGTSKIKFTNLGYGSTSLVKVIVPELAEHTILNHRNEGEDGPCLFTWGAMQVRDVVQGNPEIVDTKFKITLKKSSFINFENVCKMKVIEYLSAEIRGFHFEHRVVHDLPDRVAADCL